VRCGRARPLSCEKKAGCTTRLQGTDERFVDRTLQADARSGGRLIPLAKESDSIKESNALISTFYF
jgi:hypothetical protein